MKIVRLTRAKDDVMKTLDSSYTIVNAARPLNGIKTWEGDFICGIFYAAYNKATQQTFHKINRDKGAVELKYYTIDQARKALKVTYTDEQHQSIIDDLSDDQIEVQFDISFNELKEDKFPKNI